MGVKHLFHLIKHGTIWLVKYFWVVLLVVIIGYFLYQSSFSWEKKAEVSATNTLKSKEDVIFIVIEESYSGVKNSGFDSLSESLQTWDFNKRTKKLSVKYENLLPYTMGEDENGNEVLNYDQTKVIILYDRGFDSFERYSEVLSVASFPFVYHFKDEPFVTIHSIEEDGTVFLEFKGKQIQLKQGEDYPDMSVKGFQLVRTKIENQGIYKKNQFVPFESTKKAKEKQRKEKKGTNPEELVIPKKQLPNIHY